MIRLMGALLVAAAPACIGFQMASAVQRDKRLLQDLTIALERMQCEIRWSQPPLSELCRLVAGSLCAPAQQIFVSAAEGMEQELCAQEAFHRALRQAALPSEVVHLWDGVAETFTRFDPEQQAQILCAAQLQMKHLAHQYTDAARYTTRKYRIFGVCAGALLVIVLL